MKRNDPMARIQEAATAVAEKVREAHLDERASELAALAMEKLRESELDTKAAELAKTTRQMIRDAELEAKAAEIAALTRSRIKDSGLDDLANDVVGRVREAAVALQASDAGQHAAEAAREATDKTLEKVGEWLGDTDVGNKLADTAVGDRMGLSSPSRKRPWWALALIAGAAAAGTAVAVLRGRSETDDPWAGEEFAGTTPPSTGSVAPTAADQPLEERVREALGQDPRTADVSRLNVNVVDGTVFVRGAVAANVDQSVLRTVVEGVEGVKDVDLQVTVAT
jgi:osmotically-inducible protein OsmY